MTTVAIENNYNRSENYVILVVTMVKAFSDGEFL